MRSYHPLLALLLVTPAQADIWGNFEVEFEETKPWNELETQLPGVPKTDNLIRIDPGPATAHQYFVDKASVSAASDGVVRYSMIIKTAGGAKTINFEGMRCASGEWKVYAFGRPDGTWARNKYARWYTVKDRETGGYHKELFYHYFCTVEGPADMKAIEKAWREGGLRRGEAYLY
jgi:hypothetical protein